MTTAQEYLDSLNEKSVWLFTKQKVTSFDQIINPVKLFSEFPTNQNINFETYFADKHNEYNVKTSRHRTLVISQFFGLLTKTPFNGRGGSYDNERPTAIFDELDSMDSINDSYGYNKIISEQLLKIKIRAIIDAGNNNKDYYILPIVFMFKVLKELKDKYSIREITIDQLYTYIMTCKKYSDWKNAVEYLKDNAPISKYVSNYKDNSRILALVKNNTRLFNINNKTISINSEFEDYFQDKFMKRHDMEKFHEVLYRDVDYSYFLYNLQNFDINIIDKPTERELKKKASTIAKNDVIETEQNEENDSNYIEKINKIHEENVNTAVSLGAHLAEPVFTIDKKGKRKYKRNPLLGKIAIQNSYYSCENNHKHQTFTAKSSNKEYMEAHHLVPVKTQRLIWDKYKINVDCVENIVSLCPTCHRAFHHGSDSVKKEIIDNIYNHLVPRYRSIGFNIPLEEIYELYGIPTESYGVVDF